MKADLKQLSTHYADLVQLRAPYKLAWRELAEQFLPSKFRDNDAADSVTSGSLRSMLNTRLVDSAGVLALRTLAAGLQGGMTSPARPWFKLSLSDEDMAQHQGVQTYLSDVTLRMQGVFHRSNFYNAIHSLYADISTFGTGCMYEMADLQRGFYFITLHAGEYVIDTDYQNRVDTVFRKYYMSVRQLVQEFGNEKLPDYIIYAHEKGSVDRYAVMHCVYPVSGARPASTSKPFASVHYLDSGNGKGLHVLRESGFHELPAFAPRWDVSGTDIYGRSPAMDVLPDAKMLQQMAITTLKATHKAVDPPMSVNARLQSVGLNMAAAGLNYVDTQPGQAPMAAAPLFASQPDLTAAYAAMDKVAGQIRSGLYNDLFRMLADSSRSNITATEIASREEEKLILIGPVLERLHAEMFIPLIDRTFNLMARLDMLPPVPPELAGQDMKVEFVSLLAQAQKMVSTGALSQYMNFGLSMAGAYPEILDAINIDKALDAYGGYVGVESGIMRPQQERDAIRASRQQQQQAMQQQQTMQSLVGNARDMSDIPVDKDGTNALEAMLGGIGAQQGAKP